MNEQALDRMLSVEEAFARIVSQFSVLDFETVPLMDTLGRVLAEDVVSAEDVPAFDNSAMDGYAVRFADTQTASEADPVKLRVVGDLAAGAVPDAPLGRGEAVRIMTGAPVPPGSDAVVPFEDTGRTDWAKFGTPPGTSGDPATVGILLPPEYQDNVRFRAEDITTGETVLTRGKRIRAAEIGVMASLGKTEVAVYRRPLVAVIPTGDEVIDIAEPLEPGQVRNSAAHALEALVTVYGGIPRRLPVVGDTVEEIRQALLSCHDCDLIVTIGGVSMGDYDLVRNVLGAEGEIDFWRIRMRPGKPLAFGFIDVSGATASEEQKEEGSGSVIPAKASGSVIPAQAGIHLSPAGKENPVEGVSAPNGPKERLGTLGSPGNPGTPGSPGSPGSPGTPGSPGSPGTPDSPAQAGVQPSPWGEGQGGGSVPAEDPDPVIPAQAGIHPSSDNRRVPVVGLPGNPVSAYVTFEEFVRPALLVMQGHTHLHKTTVTARFLDSLENHGRRQFVRVIVERDDHGYTARLTGEQGSQLLTSLAKANGLAIISEHVDYVEPGSEVTVQMLDWPEES
ncbi:MAG: molybdopterin molybdotransferase MoeA [Chloroflexota bacterium]|nr:molybdopterin molybdotransferase MoeA [Chloroflexota bacterium]MDE2930130.1 molybdopterin molybdotransferase MoeA [Chloroflexota bacterium]